MSNNSKGSRDHCVSSPGNYGPFSQTISNTAPFPEIDKGFPPAITHGNIALRVYFLAKQGKHKHRRLCSVALLHVSFAWKTTTVMSEPVIHHNPKSQEQGYSDSKGDMWDMHINSVYKAIVKAPYGMKMRVEPLTRVISFEDKVSFFSIQDM
ncbi:hypothetical protein Q3G72_008762 [Acer saccharum]|nr:hypothetical protein Q3G72_008762 [Acer saccharum]